MVGAGQGAEPRQIGYRHAEPGGRDHIDIAGEAAELLDEPRPAGAGLEPRRVKRRRLQHDDIGYPQVALERRLVTADGDPECRGQTEPVRHARQGLERRGDILAEEIMQRLLALRCRRPAQGDLHQPEKIVYFREEDVGGTSAHGFPR